MTAIALYDPRDGGAAAWPLCRHCADTMHAEWLDHVDDDAECVRCGVHASDRLGRRSAFHLNPFDTAYRRTTIDGMPGQLWINRAGIGETIMFTPNKAVRDKVGQPWFWWEVLQ